MNIVKRINFLAKNKKHRYSVAVMAGYKAQVEELTTAMAYEMSGLQNVDLEFNTVDAFQGREKDIGIYSVTRSNEQGSIGFLKERRRLNVALSRAKFGLAIVGDHVFCEIADSGSAFGDILRYIRSRPDDCAIVEKK